MWSRGFLNRYVYLLVSSRGSFRGFQRVEFFLERGLEVYFNMRRKRASAAFPTIFRIREFRTIFSSWKIQNVLACFLVIARKAFLDDGEAGTPVV